MALEVVALPAGIYPDVQRLTPDVGPGQAVSESFIGSQNVQTFRGAERWRLEMQFNDLTDASRAEMMAFVVNLRVAHNVFLCVNHTAPQRGSRLGTPTVIGSASGMNMNLQGCTQNSFWLRAGDFISVNSMLKMQLRDTAATAGGICSLYLWPPFAATVTSGTPVVVSSPCGAFRMLSAVPISTDPPGYRTSLSITAVERVTSSALADFL